MLNRKIFKERADWDTLRANFRWNVPQYFNMGVACCDDWAKADPDRVAVIHVGADGAAEEFSFLRLMRASNALGNAFRARGLQRGDYCAVLLAQSPEVLITHFACHKLGMVTLPLFTLFGEDGLKYRLKDSGTRVVVTDRDNVQKVLNLKDELPDLKVIYVVEGEQSGAFGFWRDISAASDKLTPVKTLAEDPAVIIYTSGTTGPPKGALHAHRFLLGHLPAAELQHEFFPQTGDVGWTPADWAWVGGLMNIAMVCLYYGVPLVSHRMGRFDAAAAYDLIKRQGVRNLFLPPTALKLMRQVKAPADLPIRTIMSGANPLGPICLIGGAQSLASRSTRLMGKPNATFA